ncbi:MAG: acetate uptake transporter [Thermoleophilia bacterium]|nr:acetate uptake transporter [Thermoleophilia bacterium]
MSNETVTKLLDTNANPAPLGLMGFGLTTILLNIHNAGFYELNSMILAMGIFYGGVAQIIAGVMEWRKNNTFGTTAFTSYGLFWLTLAGIWLIPAIFPGTGLAASPSETALAWYFVFWGVFTGYMFLGTLKLNRALQVVFGLLTILFFLLAIRDFGGGAIWGKIAGWEGILTGLSAVYAAAAQTINEVYRRVVLPLGPISQLPKAFVADHGEEIAAMWLRDLRVSAQTPSYGKVSDEELVSASEFALTQVGDYIGGQPGEENIAEFFHNLGATRSAQGLPLPELISAILLLKREIWVSARTHGVWESAMDLQRAVDLSRELGRFFDRAVYYTTVGYTGYPLRTKDAF